MADDRLPGSPRHIDARRGELAIQFQHDHGRPPTPVEALHLAQQATLETRDAKHEPRSLAEQRATWLGEATTVLGGRGAVTSMVQTALAPQPETAPIADSHLIAQTADHILTVMEASRSTWQMWHVRAEAQRQVRTIDVPTEHATALVDLLVDEVLDRRSVALAPPHDGIEEPEVLRRVDGTSVYAVAEFIPFSSDPVHGATIEPTVHLLVDRRYERAQAAFRNALREIQNRQPGDAITDHLVRQANEPQHWASI